MRLYSGREIASDSEGMPDRTGALRIAAILSIVAACIGALEFIGFPVASFLFFLLIVSAVERHSILTGMLVALLMTAFFYLVFAVALQVQLPAGIFQY